MNTHSMHGCLQRFPGAALELSASGVVLASNGRLDEIVGRDLTGVPLEEVLDESARAKWHRHLAEPRGADRPAILELIVATADSLELRTFLAIWEGDAPDALLWLLEYSPDPARDRSYSELAALHGELVEAQRLLAREKGRLARALGEAEAAIRTRDEVLSIVSHDLRNPLSTITMAAGVLEMPIDESRKAAQIGIIKRAAEHMERLISDLLDVGAIESGNLRLELEILDIGPILTETHRMMEAKAARKSVLLQRVSVEGLGTIRGDRYRILQVLSNLVGNAIKFTPAGGSITLRARPSPGSIVVSVEDTGPGVPEEDVPHIFNRFWHSSRRKHGGAGLGLAIAQGIVEAHGGKIWLENRPGGGATFAFELPVAEEGAAHLREAG